MKYARPALNIALNDIRQAAQFFADPWWLIGSAAIALLDDGETRDVHDIDIVLSERDAKSLARHWADRLQAPSGPHHQFRSNPFYQFDGPVPVDAMANFEMRVSDSWIPVVPKTRIERAGLFVMEPTELLTLYRKMNRQKDQHRISGLERLVNG